MPRLLPASLLSRPAAATAVPGRLLPPAAARQRTTAAAAAATMASAAAPSSRRLPDTIVFVCDIQEKFRSVIFEFDKVLLTARKVLRAAALLDLPVVVTTQNRARLGDTVPELSSLWEPAGGSPADSSSAASSSTAGGGSSSSPAKAHLLLDTDKTRFSMWTPEVKAVMTSWTGSPLGAVYTPVVIVGIEAHICVTQTALDLRAAGHPVFVLADGVSSCNREEVGVALARLRMSGVTVTTSESWLYETIGDAGHPVFRSIVALVKETSADTRTALSTLLSPKI